MTEEINPSELGAFTNNLSNKEGIKKLINAVEGNTSAIATKQDKLTAGSNVAISDQNVISATDTKYTAGDNIAISDQNVISATDTKYTAGTGISISEQNVISASGDGSWELCENGCYDVYADTNNEYIYTTRIQDGWIFFTHENCDAQNTVTYVKPCLGKTYYDLQVFSIKTNPSNKAQGRISNQSYALGYQGSNITYKQSETILYDLITNAQIQAADIDNYIDPSTSVVLKPFVASLKNGKYVLQFNTGAKEAFYVDGKYTTTTFSISNYRTMINVTTDNIKTVIGGTNVTNRAPQFGLLSDNLEISSSQWANIYIYKKKHNLPVPPTS